MPDQPTQEQFAALIAAMDAVLDDMGPSGQSVCLHTKAAARIAFEPFLDPDDAAFVMPLAEAERIVRETEDGR